MDASRPHEEVVSPPQVLGQRVTTVRDERLERLEVGRGRPEREVEEVVGHRLDLGPPATQYPPRQTERVLRLVLHELGAHEPGDRGAPRHGEGPGIRRSPDAVPERG